MEDNLEILEDFITNEDLDNYLLTRNKSPRNLSLLLKIKHERIRKGNGEKIAFPIEHIYKQSDKFDIDMQCNILSNILKIIINLESCLLESINYFIKELLNHQENHKKLLNDLKLFNIILRHCNKTIIASDVKVKLQNLIVTLIKSADAKNFSFIASTLLSTYFKIINQHDRKEFYNTVCSSTTTFRNFSILCSQFEFFFSSDVNSEFNLLLSNDFWLILAENLCHIDTFIQKQAIYILSKTIELVKNITDVTKLPTCIKPNIAIGEFNNNNNKAWRNYMILHDISNEKQLHLIEPSLHLLNSIQILDSIWKCSLYIKFLNHSQNFVVYFTVIFILQNEHEWSFLCTIFKHLLSSLNKNEYSSDSRKAFAEFTHFCARLETDKIEQILNFILEISWSPTAMWCLCKSIFSCTSKWQISIKILGDIVNLLKKLPNIYIREGCIHLINDYIINKLDVNSYGELESHLIILQQFGNIDLYILINKKVISMYKSNIIEEFSKCLNSDNMTLCRLEILLKLLINLEELETIFAVIKATVEYSPVTDLIYSIIYSYLTHADIEKYIQNRIAKYENNDEDITYLLSLITSTKPNNNETIKTCIDILLKDNKNNYKNKQIIAFHIIKFHNLELVDYNLIVMKLMSNAKIDEKITQCCIEILIKHCISPDNLKDIVTILEQILSTQSAAVSEIFNNFAQILTYANNPEILDLIVKCFNEFLVLNKYTRSFSKDVSERFLNDLLVYADFHNAKLRAEIVAFCRELLSITNNSTEINLNLAKSLKKTLESREFEHYWKEFLPIICDLFIMFGIIVQKNERVEYLINQDIQYEIEALKFENPNLGDVSIRLWAMESLITIIEAHKSVADDFVLVLVKKYMKHFNKRYFPDSQIHLQKLRIIQALLIISPFIKEERSGIINLICDSFLLESHQTSVKHLMQWLLIILLKSDETAIKLISGKLELANKFRPSSVTAFVPVIFNLAMFNDNEEFWEEVVEVILPGTMGPHFKLRLFSQTALMKLYDAAKTKKYDNFRNKYKFIYDSILPVIEKSTELDNIDNEFLEYFPIDTLHHSYIYYTIPRITGVAASEWENLKTAIEREKIDKIVFSHQVATHELVLKIDNSSLQICSDNIQKKITPWKMLLLEEKSDVRKNSHDFMLVTSLIEKSANLGGLARTCEVFGIKQFVMKTSKITKDQEFRSLSMSAENWLDITEVKVEDLKDFIVEIKRKGYVVIGAEQTSESVKLDQFQFSKLTVLVLGNEKEGISPDLIPLLDCCIEIPQFGVVRSLNVHVAGAIMLWEFCKQHML